MRHVDECRACGRPVVGRRYCGDCDEGRRVPDRKRKMKKGAPAKSQKKA